MATFLSLPLEIRLQIYSLLLTYPPYSISPAGPIIQPSVLRACKQTYAEALPILYTSNQFVAHHSLLTSFPNLRAWHDPVSAPSVLGLIRKWYLRVRLDCDARWDRQTVTAAFTGCDELVVEIWQAMFLGTGCAVLTMFEGVRGVKRVEIIGSTTGFEDYLRWLESLMMSPIGTESDGFHAMDGKPPPFLEKW